MDEITTNGAYYDSLAVMLIVIAVGSVISAIRARNAGPQAKTQALRLSLLSLCVGMIAAALFVPLICLGLNWYMFTLPLLTRLCIYVWDRSSYGKPGLARNIAVALAIIIVSYMSASFVLNKGISDYMTSASSDFYARGYSEGDMSYATGFAKALFSYCFKFTIVLVLAAAIIPQVMRQLLLGQSESACRPAEKASNSASDTTPQPLPETCRYVPDAVAEVDIGKSEPGTTPEVPCQFAECSETTISPTDDGTQRDPQNHNSGTSPSTTRNIRWTTVVPIALIGVAIVVGALYVLLDPLNTCSLRQSEQSSATDTVNSQPAATLSREPQRGEMSINPKDGAEMVWVPAGEFLMGSDAGDHPENQEYPQHKVYLDGLWMYKYEVTVAHYRKFCEATNRDMPDPPRWGWKDDHPIVNVTWDDADTYAQWADARLPTEAEWEKAARGNDGRMYPWGNTWDKSKCANGELGLASVAPVGSYSADRSPYGCQDMAGNVSEWCQDWYDYYRTSPSRNPKGPPTSNYRVLRGGGWADGNYGTRCAFRCSGGFPNGYNCIVGFRLAR